ncbi:MAG: hypothetical protein NWE89_12270 [Candidatus Bathyarchaeota archaeon]|nr:hypothetical protein [Candidatus Bathyarchaeota archaeon]
MTVIEEPLCATCKHVNFYSKQDLSVDKPTCDAFPEGIPDVFWLGGKEHTKPYSGDHGIQFEVHKE